MSIGNYTKLAAKAIAGTTKQGSIHLLNGLLFKSVDHFFNSSLDMWLAQLIDFRWLFFWI